MSSPILILKNMQGFYVSDIPKLKDLCVDCVVRHFDVLMMAHDSNKVPKKPFEHLQITQSQTLLDHFSRKEAFSRYIKFFLNPLAKDINLKLCAWDPHDVMEQLIEIASTVKSLYLSGRNYMPDAMLDLTSGMINLKSLTLHAVIITKDVLQNIGKFCTSLEILNMCGCHELSDEIVTALCLPTENGIFRQNETLKCFDIRQTSLTPVGIAFVLKHFPNLEFIRHQIVFNTLCNIHASSLESNSFDHLKPYNLKKLIISDKGQFFHKNALKMCSTLCPRVNELSVGYISSQSQLDTLTEFRGLNKLCIVSKKDMYFDLSSFIEVRGNNLRELFLKDGSVSMQTLLKCCTKLKVLKLQDIHFKSAEESGCGRLKYAFPHLEALSIECMDFSNCIVSKSIDVLLSSAPNLENLTFLSVDRLCLDFVNSISGHSCMKTLQELNVINTEIEAAAIKELLMISPSIKKYNLKDTPIRYRVYQEIQALKPMLKIVTDYSSFVWDDVREDEPGNDDAWMDDHDDEDYSVGSGSWTEDSEFEAESADEEEEISWDEEEDDDFNPQDIIDDMALDELEADLLMEESDYSISDEDSDSDEDESSDMDVQEERSSVDEEDDVSWTEEDHERSSSNMRDHDSDHDDESQGQEMGT